jgi:hypothetical protein
MEAQPAMSTPTRTDFLEQASVAQAALKSLLAVSEHRDSDRDDDVVRFVINKAIKATVCHFHIPFMFDVF